MDLWQERTDVDRFDGQIAGETKGLSSRQQEAFTFTHLDGVGYPLDHNPALAAKHCVKLDAIVRTELHGPVAVRIEAAGYIASQLQ